MDSTEILDELRCALSDDNHLLINQITLSKCGQELFARTIYQMIQKLNQLNVKNVG
jgi:hypothetical protein